jgi:hypothetical protein
MGACGVGVYVKVYDGGMVGRIQLTSVALVVCVHDRGAPVHTATVARALAAACEQGRTGAAVKEPSLLTPYVRGYSATRTCHGASPCQAERRYSSTVPVSKRYSETTVTDLVTDWSGIKPAY